MKDIFSSLRNAIEKGQTLAPFLFVWSHQELVNTKIRELSSGLLSEYNIDENSFFVLSDDNQAIKIQEMREFISKSNEKPRFAFQVFFIENIGRMTTQSANAALKFFEEPGVGNIIFLSNTSEAWVLPTVLSRVQTIRVDGGSSDNYDGQYDDMVQQYFSGWDIGLISFLYSFKWETEDYKNILKSIIAYIQKTGTHALLLEEIEKDIQGLHSNNLSGKYVVDKYLLV